MGLLRLWSSHPNAGHCLFRKLWQWWPEHAVHHGRKPLGTTDAQAQFLETQSGRLHHCAEWHVGRCPEQIHSEPYGIGQADLALRGSFYRRTGGTATCARSASIYAINPMFGSPLGPITSWVAVYSRYPSYT